MSLESRFREIESKTGEFSTGTDRGEQKKRCPKCGKWIRVPHYVKDFLHEGCYTEDEFDETLLATSAISFAGMKTEPETRRRRHLTQARDATQDCFIVFKD